MNSTDCIYLPNKRSYENKLLLYRMQVDIAHKTIARNIYTPKAVV